MQRTEAKAETRRGEIGFTLIEILIAVTIITVVTAFATIGINRARASMRLSGAAREFASYVEKVRVDSIRRHADGVGQAASVAINPDRTSYLVTLDFNGDGTMETRAIPLPDGVSFNTEETIAFDWRGRTWNTVGGVTSADAQVSITLTNGAGSVSIDVTGSGDVTIDSRLFDDSVPDVDLNVPDLGSAPTPTPGASPTPTPSASPSATPTPDVSPSPTPDPSSSSTPDPTPTPATPTPTPTPAPTPTPDATPTPSPSPTPIGVCTITASPDSMTISQDGTATLSVSHNSSATVSITGSSSRPSDLQVTPAGAQSVPAGSSATFVIKSKRNAGSYTVTFSAACGQTVVPVTVQ